MAGPTDPTTQDTTTDLNAAAQAASAASDAFGQYGQSANDAATMLSTLQSKLAGVGVSLTTNQQLTQGQTAAFGLLSTAVLGARDAFTQLQGVDTSGLDTFRGQLQELKSYFGGVNAFTVGSEATKKLADGLKSVGVAGSVVDELARAGGTAILSFADKFFAGADNALKLQNSIIQLSASTGRLSDVYAAAGPNLENINLITKQYQASINETGLATGVTTSQVEKYYAELGNVPGALGAVVKGGTGVNGTISMLTATMQYAAGSGRKFEDVTKDLNVAFRDYNLTGEDALKFTARIGELANKFHVQLSDVQSSLTATAESFKMYGNEAEGAANMMNEYLGALESTGLSGSAAIDVVNGMTAGIKNLNIAQKSFLSAQTGGPGGLMGGFQIEKMMREGKMDEVMDKVKSTLTRQFGQIMTLNEASQSPQAAAQFQKQILMLRQGPLGSFAKDDQSAMRLLEAMKTGQKGAVDALKPDIVQDMTKKGIDIQSKSYTTLRQMLQIMEQTRGQAGFANLSMAQGGLTAATGEEGEEGDRIDQARLRNNLTQGMGTAAARSGTVTTGLTNEMATRQVKEHAGNFAVQAVNNWKEFFDGLGPALKAPIEKIRSLFASGKGEDAVAETKRLMDDIDRKKEALRTAAPAVRDAGLAALNEEQANVQAATGYLSKGGPTETGPTLPTISPTLGGLFTPSSQVGAAAATSAKTGAATTANGAPPQIPIHPNQTQPQSVSGEITVHVVVSDEMGKQLQNHAQRFAISPQSK
jgi:hypothetical protein